MNLDRLHSLSAFGRQNEMPDEFKFYPTTNTGQPNKTNYDYENQSNVMSVLAVPGIEDQSDNPGNSNWSKNHSNIMENYFKTAKPVWGNHRFDNNRKEHGTNAAVKSKKIKQSPFHNELEELVYASNDEVVKKLFIDQISVSEFIEDIPPHSFPLLLKLLKKVCLSTTLATEKMTILSIVCHHNVLEHFATQIIEARKMNPSDVKVILQNMILIFETVLKILPYSSIIKIAPFIQGCFMCAQELKLHYNVFIEDAILSKMKILSEQVDQLKVIDENFNFNCEMLLDRMKNIPPPNNFRSLSVFPTAQEILCNKRPTLRPNLKNARYENVEHYLDTQYRLLREDFVRPLREGIALYIDNGCTKPTSGDRSIRLYSNVRFLRSSFKVEENEEEEETCEENAKIVGGTKVQFICSSKSKLKNIDWRSSKRLMHNSLVCFTKNNFETLLFATVTYRDASNLSKGIVHVEFCEAYNENIYDSPYLMIENEVYFEPYFHVMNTLQYLNSSTLPMSKYLIDLNCTDSVPAYTSLMSDEITYTLQGVDNKCYSISLLDKSSWPSHEQLGLDPSQHQALQAGLTQELAVIQGPPGTGKTFIGLKIAQSLLLSPQKEYHTGPILVVCLTNHALDQFLLGIIKFACKLVRVGGQSKNGELEIYNIKHMRRYTKYEMEIIVPAREQIQNHHEEIVSISSYLDSIQGDEPHAIAAMSTLQTYKVVPPEVAKCLHSGMLLFWLGLGGYDNPEADTMCNPLAIELSTIQLDVEIRDVEKIAKKSGLEDFITNYLSFLNDLKSKLKKCLINRVVTTQVNINYLLSYCKGNLWVLKDSQRWQLYWSWVQNLTAQLEQKMKKHQEHKVFLKQRLENVRRDVDLKIMKQCDVVGMTTNCAARLYNDLCGIQPEILIVEEAAEVLESHIIACLTKSCKHLILIGDHKQLRPATSVYELAKHYDFDVSLFERLVYGRGSCVTLGVQHRMSPSIASLITPSIYTELKNHKTTQLLPAVLGLPKRLYFVSHSYYELKENENSSYKNEFEAKYLLALAEHLIHQGYRNQQITILTTYTAQMSYILREMKNCPLLKGIRVTVVDNFQGEENDIILLSLVRSNDFNHVGFMATENRVCVALSRARHGLYMVGNMNCLTKASKLWCNINNTLESLQAIGPALSIKCQKHPQSENVIQHPSQFKSVAPLGGCNKLCSSKLHCGHSCNRFCHIENHSVYKCELPCIRLCGQGHPCLKLCHETCKCAESTIKKLPVCHHTVNIPCCVDDDYDDGQIQCVQDCNTVLSCGHICPRKCHVKIDPKHQEISCREPCKRLRQGCNANHTCSKKCYEKCEPCKIKVQVSRPCGHLIEVDCNKSGMVDRIDTSKNTYQNDMNVRQCTYEAVKKYEANFGPCCFPTVKHIPDCKHVAKMLCHEQPRRELCDQKCERRIACGHICHLRCAEPCTSQCLHEVSLAKGICGHKVPLLCWEQNEGLLQPRDPQRCDMPCSTALECGHLCSGTCGQCLQGRFHIPCVQDCLRTLVCGHRCPARCYESCVPCKQQCTYSCPHARCLNKCGEQCSPCKEECTRQCEHAKCSRKCGDVCDVPPCKKTCFKLLRCRHPCLGMCGDPCPPLCAECQPEEIYACTLGKNTPSGFRLVLLPSCGHVFEMSTLEEKINTDALVVGVRGCPLCGKPLANVPRYFGRIKKAYADIQQVYTKLVSTHWSLSNKKLFEKELVDLMYRHPHTGSENLLLVQKLEELRVSLKPKLGTNKIVNGQMMLHMQYIQFCLLRNLWKVWKFYSESDFCSSNKHYLTDMINHILQVVSSENYKYGQQQINDCCLELLRIKRIAQLELLKNSLTCTLPELKTFETLILDVSEPYSEQKEQVAANLINTLKKSIHVTDMTIEPLPCTLHLSKGFWFKCPNNHVALLIGKNMCQCLECGITFTTTGH